MARGMSRLPSHRTRQRGARFETALTGNACLSTHAAQRDRRPEPAEHEGSGCWDSGSVRPSEEGLLRRPQRPRFPSTRHDTSCETLQQFTLENCRKPHAQQPVAALLRQPTHALRATLLEAESDGNRKFPGDCVEPVQERNCLWKREEKAEKTRPADSEWQELRGRVARAHTPAPAPCVEEYVRNVVPIPAVTYDFLTDVI